MTNQVSLSSLKTAKALGKLSPIPLYPYRFNDNFDRIANDDYYYFNFDLSGSRPKISVTCRFLTLPMVRYMFSSTNLSAYITEANIINAKEIYGSFNYCGVLKKVTINANDIIIGDTSFYNCISLTQLIDSTYHSISNLVEFNNLTYGNFMFYNTKLENIKISLPSLIDAPGMFGGDSSLDSQSAIYILNSLPNYTSGNHRISIALKNIEGNIDMQLSDLANSKGWGFTLN